MQEYFSILTNKGIDLLLKAAANKTQIALSKMSVSDDEGEIDQSITRLEGVKHSFSINSLIVDEADPHQLIAEGVINADAGGFYINKAGIYTANDELFAVAKLPRTYKPKLAEGSAKDITIKFIMQVDNANDITLKVDNNIVLATRKWTQNLLSAKANALDVYTKTQCDDKFALKAKVLEQIKNAAPAGTIIASAAANAPEGYLLCDGSALSRSAYSALFTAIGTAYGAGDKTTTFNIPDLRGEFLRGADNGRGIDSGRVLGSAQGDAIRNIRGAVGIGKSSSLQANGTISGVFADNIALSGAETYQDINSAVEQSKDVVTFDASKVVPTANENRPRNVAVNYFIKY